MLSFLTEMPILLLAFVVVALIWLVVLLVRPLARKQDQERLRRKK